ncbi:MAG: hypothetical protein NC548_39060 [Lachnospiraceae bacterium]|nr:hypothetical protein [Lachnospiraceae bacterium]
MLTFNLKKEWYEKIASGEKRIEYREVKPYWTKRLNKEFAVYTSGGIIVPFNPHLSVESIDCSECPQSCVLRLGYTKKFMTAKIVEIKVVDGKDTDLKIDKPVYAIHLDEIKEEKG